MMIILYAFYPDNFVGFLIFSKGKVFKMKKTNIKWMVKVSMLGAVAVVLMLLEFPIPFIAPPFYEFDFSEVPVLIGAFALGPVAGAVIELVKVLLNLLVNGTITAGVGEFANFMVGISFVLPAGLLYKRCKDKKHAALGLIAGSVCMVALGFVVNLYILIPTYGKALGMPIAAFVEMGSSIYPPIDSLWKMVLLCVVPFNAIKALAASVVTMLIYKHISPILKG